MHDHVQDDTGSAFDAADVPSTTRFLSFVRRMVNTAPAAALTRLRVASVAELASLSPNEWRTLLDWALTSGGEEAVVRMGRILAWIPDAVADPSIYRLLVDLDDAEVLAALCVCVPNDEAGELFVGLCARHPEHARYLLEHCPRLRTKVGDPAHGSSVPSGEST